MSLCFALLLVKITRTLVNLFLLKGITEKLPKKKKKKVGCKIKKEKTPMRGWVMYSF